MFTVLTVLDNMPEPEQAQRHEAWRTAQHVIEWLTRRGHPTSGIRASGGFLYHVTALDPFSAASNARELLDRLVARSSFLRGDRSSLRPAAHLWVDQHPDPIPFATPARSADVLSLRTEGRLYRVDGWPTAIDEAFELASPVNRGARGREPS
jgi:hypothetical protein